MKKSIKGEKKKRAKLILLTGKKISREELDKRVHVSNSPEIIRKLKREGMNIEMKRTPNKNEPGWHGVYKYIPPKKESRILTREYR